MRNLLHLGVAARPFAAAAYSPRRAASGSAALKIVPLVGHAAATPTDACASAIDP